MDLYCPKCGEPWDLDCLHDEAQARYGVAYGSPDYNRDEYRQVFEAVSAEFRSKGCVTLATAYGISGCDRVDNDTTAAARVAYEVLGDDLDGAASMLDDLRLP